MNQWALCHFVSRRTPLASPIEAARALLGEVKCVTANSTYPVDVASRAGQRHRLLLALRGELGVLAAPPAMIPIEYEVRYPQHAWTTVAGSNHYDVLIGESGASTVADVLSAAVTDRS